MVITSLGSDEAVESVASQLLAGQEVCVIATTSTSRRRGRRLVSLLEDGRGRNLCAGLTIRTSPTKVMGSCRVAGAGRPSLSTPVRYVSSICSFTGLPVACPSCTLDQTSDDSEPGRSISPDIGRAPVQQPANGHSYTIEPRAPKSKANNQDPSRHSWQTRTPNLFPASPHLPLVSRIWRPARRRIRPSRTRHLGRLFRKETRGSCVGTGDCEKGYGFGK